MVSREEILEKREKLENHLGNFVATVLTKKDHNSFIEKMKKLSDDDFVNFVRLNFNINNEGPMNTREMLNAQRSLIDNLGISVSESGLSNLNIIFLSDEDNNELINRLSLSHVSDTIYLDTDADEKIMDLWEKQYNNGSRNGIAIPSDLFFAGTIPLMDCHIIVDERGTIFDDHKGRITDFRVTIFSDYKDLIDDSNDEVVTVGLVLANVNQYEEGSGSIEYGFLHRIQCVKGVDCILSGYSCGWIGIDKDIRNMFARNLTLDKVTEGMSMYLDTWYGIQLSLLHPTVKEIFQKPVDSFKWSTKVPRTRVKRKIGFTRKHIIKECDITDALTKGNYNRTTLAWYVVGHWRKYESGKKIFIQGYWKGPLRETKRNLDDGRDREVV